MTDFAIKVKTIPRDVQFGCEQSSLKIVLIQHFENLIHKVREQREAHKKAKDWSNGVSGVVKLKDMKVTHLSKIYEYEGGDDDEHKHEHEEHDHHVVDVTFGSTDFSEIKGLEKLTEIRKKYNEAKK